MDKDEILDRLAQHVDGDIGEWHYLTRSDEDVVGIPGVVRVVEATGGEGEGDGATIVWQVADDTSVRHFKMYGFYASYHGFDWDGPFVEVSPVERTYTAYEEV